MAGEKLDEIVAKKDADLTAKDLIRLFKIGIGTINALPDEREKAELRIVVVDFAELPMAEEAQFVKYLVQYAEKNPDYTADVAERLADIVLSKNGSEEAILALAKMLSQKDEDAADDVFRRLEDCRPEIMVHLAKAVVGLETALRRKEATHALAVNSGEDLLKRTSHVHEPSHKDIQPPEKKEPPTRVKAKGG